MPVINTSIERAVRFSAGANSPLSDVLAKVKDALRKEFGDDAWRWFHTYENSVIYTLKKKVLGFTINVPIKVKYARKLVEELAGPDPFDAREVLP